MMDFCQFRDPSGGRCTFPLGHISTYHRTLPAYSSEVLAITRHEAGRLSSKLTREILEESMNSLEADHDPAK